MSRLIFTLVLLLLLSSCDPGFSVILSNQSSTSKNVKVIVTNKDKINYLDSIAIIDSLYISERLMIAVSKDTNANSYSFILEKGKSAVLQQGIAGPDLTEKIITNFSDTISLSGDRRVIKERKGIGTLITVRLE